MLSFAKGNRGMALILIYLLLSLLVIILSVFFYTSIQAMKVSQRRLDLIKAFYAAESGLDVALQDVSVASFSASLGTISTSGYAGTITPLDATKSTINSIGYSPSSTANPRVEVQLQVVAEIIANDDFFDNALYSASNLTLKGNAYNIVGDLFYDQDSTLDVSHPENVIGAIAPGDPIDFTTDIDYALLRSMAQAQEDSDVFDHTVDVSNFSSSSLPASFWYDEANGIPNVIYVEGTGDLVIAGTMVVGGFFVVTSGDCQISGAVTLDGCLLSTDDLKVSGTINATGGLWAGGVVDDESANKDGAFISGNITLTYNQTFMDAIESTSFLAPGNTVVMSWQETRREAI